MQYHDFTTALLGAPFWNFASLDLPCRIRVYSVCFLRAADLGVLEQH